MSHQLREALKQALGQRRAEVTLTEKRTSTPQKIHWEFWFGGSRVIMAEYDKEVGGYYWRLYVNQGNTATSIGGKTKTEAGMRRAIQRAADQHMRESRAAEADQLWRIADEYKYSEGYGLITEYALQIVGQAGARGNLVFCQPVYSLKRRKPVNFATQVRHQEWVDKRHLVRV